MGGLRWRRVNHGLDTIDRVPQELPARECRAGGRGETERSEREYRGVHRSWKFELVARWMEGEDG